MTRGLYVYGIVRTGALAEPPAAAAVDPAHGPTLYEGGPLTAVVSEVDVGAFEGEALERNVASPQWLEQKVRAHESVLDEVLARAAVVPMRFGSIFSTDDGLRGMLREHADALLRALARVEGRSEWGVKVHCDRAALTDRLAGVAPGGGTGRGYLLQKKARLAADARAAEAGAAVAAEAHRRLGLAAEKGVLAPPRDPGVVLNASYLVLDSERDAFMRRVAELQEHQGPAFLFDVTGPWPPYHFTSADVGGPAR